MSEQDDEGREVERHPDWPMTARAEVERLRDLWTQAALYGAGCDRRIENLYAERDALQRQVDEVRRLCEPVLTRRRGGMDADALAEQILATFPTERDGLTPGAGQ